MFFRFLISIGSLFGFVTGGLDLLERFGVPVDDWLRALPAVASDFFAWFGFQVDQIALAAFGSSAQDASAPVLDYSQGSDSEEVVMASRSLMMDSSDQALWISGGFTALMLIILLMAARRS
ncbi:hypothetical protein V0U79_13315 [Hyphobacterium sp. HN65]|uniref:Uncharacterized protein n=1 Tax=Hyphobacterium lacteum TaxID=3116575 RepID=A0ABU7LU09_9PROT|nr:hypothetical protein [Hyphobacterium sp. HN65]MEE2527340.1 hypothetical protein [Hyphobacterium sp. HN65]